MFDIKYIKFFRKKIEYISIYIYIYIYIFFLADVAQLVERGPSKSNVARSSRVIRFYILC